MSAASKDMKKAVAACVRAGLIHDPTGKHPRIVHPGTGRVVTYSASPSCPHAYKHLLKEVHKYLGVEVEL